MCQTSVCFLCNKMSWVSCGDSLEEHISTAMGTTPKKYWCNCENVILEGDNILNTKYPPSAGTGHRRSSSVNQNLFSSNSFTIGSESSSEDLSLNKKPFQEIMSVETMPGSESLGGRNEPRGAFSEGATISRLSHIINISDGITSLNR